jgi:hypothetical protein
VTEPPGGGRRRGDLDDEEFCVSDVPAAPGRGWVVAAFDSRAAGSTVRIVRADGTVVGGWTAGTEFSRVEYSSADVESGVVYTVLVDGAAVATVTAHQTHSVVCGR